MTIDQIMRLAPVIPVLVLDGTIDPAALAATLVAAGLPVLEVTLRTPGALDAIRTMAAVPGAIVGAGTVLSPLQLDAAVAAGARFIVSPGLTAPVAGAAEGAGVAYLPGVATAGDIMRGLDLGLDRFKFFPAEASGGIPAIKALSAPFADIRFCPTGGITEASAPAWLALDAVLCVGGSWLLRPKTVEGADGKLVRLGRFKTESEALENWRGTLSKYPGMEDLPAIAVPLKSLRDGSVFYRLQVGTTSQAHSAVICQRVQKLHQRCTVIGLEAGTKDTGL